jgi:hypothetical protein
MLRSPMTDEVLWRTVLDRVKCGAIRPEYASGYWFNELRAMLDQAERHVTLHDPEATIQLRELQARCESILRVIAPEETATPKLVVAA